MTTARINVVIVPNFHFDQRSRYEVRTYEIIYSPRILPGNLHFGVSINCISLPLLSRFLTFSLLYVLPLDVTLAATRQSRKIRAIRVAGAAPGCSFLELSSRVCRFDVFQELGYRVHVRPTSRGEI